MVYDWSKYTVLIADDEIMITEFFREVLSLTKINMHFAEDGAITIEMVEQHPEIDLVLLDIRMPKINGYEVFKRIKSIRPDLPVVAQTAFAFSDDIEKIIAAGFDDYITKPIMNDVLYEKIDVILKK